MIGSSGARYIKAALKVYGEHMHRGHPEKPAASWRTYGQRQLESHVGHGGPGRPWHLLPMESWSKARLKLAEMQQMAERLSADKPSPPQRSLDLKAPAAPLPKTR